MTDIDATTRAPQTQQGRPSRAWTLWGVAAGVLGAAATIFTTVAPPGHAIGPSVLDKVDRLTYHIGGALGYIVVACLLVLAGCWRATIARTAPRVAAARVVADGLTASAAGLALGYGWKLAIALYLPGGLNQGQFGREGQFVYYVLNDFGAYLGWLGVVVAAGAMAWLGLRTKLISTWLGVVSLIPPLAVAFMSLGMTIAGYPGIVAPIWLVVAYAALALGRHQIADTP